MQLLRTYEMLQTGAPGSPGAESRSVGSKHIESNVCVFVRASFLEFDGRRLPEYFAGSRPVRVRCFLGVCTVIPNMKVVVLRPGDACLRGWLRCFPVCES